MSTFQCWVCQQQGQPCSSQTFRKENWPNCEAASKGLGFPAFSSKEKCDQFCTGGKPIDLSPVCWVCEGEAGGWKCHSFLGQPGEKCPDKPGIFSRQSDCQKSCTPFRPLEPPVEPVVPEKDLKILWYILIAFIVIVFVALIIGALYFLT